MYAFSQPLYPNIQSYTHIHKHPNPPSSLLATQALIFEHTHRHKHTLPIFYEYSIYSFTSTFTGKHIHTFCLYTFIKHTFTPTDTLVHVSYVHTSSSMHHFTLILTSVIKDKYKHAHTNTQWFICTCIRHAYTYSYAYHIDTYIHPVPTGTLYTSQPSQNAQVISAAQN